MAAARKARYGARFLHGLRSSSTLDPVGGSSNGRTADSDSASLGSNPSPPANWHQSTFLRLLLRTASLVGSPFGRVCSRFELLYCRFGQRRVAVQIVAIKDRPNVSQRMSGD